MKLFKAECLVDVDMNLVWVIISCCKSCSFYSSLSSIKTNICFRWSSAFTLTTLKLSIIMLGHFRSYPPQSPSYFSKSYISLLTPPLPQLTYIRGPGGFHQDFLEIDFLVVSDRDLSETFYQIKKYCS